ncbi:MAG: hypothetical protein CL674_01255 [Bdellovibrionaceae bacterium]|nr:hypothetical protein [Pseudobdellovibrionaceae bacterium]|tara:strand:+ start:29078 stop:32251 length:3174 start_codon:yes stop_codon:yes gene_type:complete
MKKLFYFFIDNYKVSLVLMGLAILMGLQGLANLRKESRPPVDFAKAQVLSLYPGSSAEEVEEKITRKIEDEIRQVDGLKDVKSVSQAGRSTITIRVDMDNVDTDEVMNELQRAVQKVSDLPEDMLEAPTFTRFKAAEIPIFELTINGSNEDRKRDALAFQLKTELEDIKGVAEVRYSGYREREYQILLKPEKMRSLHVGIPEVLSAVRGRTQNIPAGSIEDPENQMLVRVTGQVEYAQELANLVVRSNFSGQKILIKDIADVRDGMEDATILTRNNGQPATVLTVTKKEKADTLDTVAQLEMVIEGFKERMLPEGYSLTVFNNESTRIKEQLGIVIGNAVGGLALVLIILIIFLPGSLGFATALSLPIALLGTIGLMPGMGVTFNTISMMALVIAIGMLVDNSVVISENYARLREEGLEIKEAALKAAHQFWVPLTATVLTTIAAFLPMLVTKGVMGQFIKWIPIIVTLSLSMSLLESFFLLPARLQWTVRNVKPKEEEEKRDWFEGIQNRFEAFMRLAIRRRYIVSVLIGLLFFGSLFINVFLNRFELFPSNAVETYLAFYETPIEYNLEKTDSLTHRLVEDVHRVLADEPKDMIESIITRAGVAMKNPGDANAKNGEYVGMMQIVVPAEIAREQDSLQILKKLRGIDKGQFTKLSFEAQKNGPPVGAAMSLTFRSNYKAELKELVGKFQSEISKIEGVVDLETDVVRGGPEFRVIPNYQRIASMNINTNEVGTALRTALQGAIVSELTRDGDDFYIRVRYRDKERATMKSLKNTYIMDSATRRLVPLYSIVDIKREEAPEVRKHFDMKTAITVTSNVEQDKITSIVLNKKAADIAQNLLKDYPRVSLVVGGEAESTKESISSLMQAMVLSALGIFGILVFLFRSFLRSFLVISTIPLGLIGVSISFFLHNRPLSFFALIGVVGLAGVIVNAAIVLVSYIDETLEEGKLSFQDALAQASTHRLRSVLVTGLTTVGGLMPSAYGIGGTDEVLVPMTLALSWGLISGTIVTLIWVPCGYAIIEDYMAVVWKVVGFIREKIFRSNQDAFVSSKIAYRKR